MSQTQVEEPYILKDFNGLIRADIAFLEKTFKQLDYVPNKHTIEDVAFVAGQQSVIRFIKEQMVSRRNELTNQL